MHWQRRVGPLAIVSSLSQKYYATVSSSTFGNTFQPHTSYRLFNCTKDIRHTKIKEEKTGVNTRVVVAVLLQICSVPVANNN